MSQEIPKVDIFFFLSFVGNIDNKNFCHNFSAVKAFEERKKNAKSVGVEEKTIFVRVDMKDAQKEEVDDEEADADSLEEKIGACQIVKFLFWLYVNAQILLRKEINSPPPNHV